MKRTVKNLLIVIMTLTLACTCALPAFASDNYDDLIAPCYYNCATTTTSFSVVNGVAYVGVTYSAYTDTFTYAKLTVKIQKQFLGLFGQQLILAQQTMNGLDIAMIIKECLCRRLM